MGKLLECDRCGSVSSELDTFVWYETDLLPVDQIKPIEGTRRIVLCSLCNEDLADVIEAWWDRNLKK